MVRINWLLLHDRCVHCGGTTALEVHHTIPFHLHPEFELDPENFMTLCESHAECHLKFGHLGNWYSYNPLCVSAQMLEKLKPLYSLTHPTPPE